MERLGLGPEVALAHNPRLTYGRATGYGQDGPLAAIPGHDINYISVAGALGAIARQGERPLLPLNLLADYGGGGMLLAFGIVCAVMEARGSGEGQVVDAAMVDGAALLTTAVHGWSADGSWSDEPGTNTLDSGAHFYEVYETLDGGYVTVGALAAAVECGPRRASRAPPRRSTPMGQAALARAQAAVRRDLQNSNAGRMGRAA
jgi:alpha-methylacyl-CoA racemase